MESSSSSTSSSAHRSGTTTTTGELFICFSSRNNSMKSSAKTPSILSPGRARDPPTSLSNSVSRRLRTSGSIKNGQASPMFPTGNKRRGSGFENPEPSSPKVTCIGQVRVKTKKQGKKMRSLSRRPSGEMSFRKMEHNNQMQRQSSVNSIHHHQQECSSHRNQRWVHLPLTICETLRGFGSEFSCLFPCKSSCFSGERVERERGRSSSCADVFAKWLVAVEDESREISPSGGKRRDIELVVEDEDDEEEEGKVVKRRHVFDEIEIKDYDEERGRVSICIPPKNALLLMRCRSDPVKMEALASRFSEPQLPVEDEQQEDDNAVVSLERVEVENEVEEMEVFEERRASVSGDIFDKVEESEAEQQEEDIKFEVEDLIVSEQVQESGEEKILEEDLDASEEEKEEKEEVEDLQSDIEEAQNDEQDNAVEDLQSNEEAEDVEKKIQVEEVEENELSFVTALEVFGNQDSELVEEGESRASCDSNDEFNELNEIKHIRYILLDYKSDDEVSKPEQTETEQENALQNHAIEDSTDVAETEEENQQQDQTQTTDEEEVKNNVDEVLERESEVETKKEEGEPEKSQQQLPDCLLLMMCEPKLSMEVSKETWVCSTDFIRRRPQKKKPHAPPCHYNKASSPGSEEQVAEKRTSVVDSNPFAALPPPYPVTHNQAALQPGRASCCLPAGGVVSMATMIEQKLVDAVAYEPFVLTRCKSEPMRTAAKLAQGACFWKNRALEPHRRATYGAAGVGC